MAANDGTPPPLSTLTITDKTVTQSAFSQRVPIKSILSRPDGGAGLAGQIIKVGGWVKKGREQGKGTFAFIELNDGSCPANLQLMIYSDVGELSDYTPTGTSLHVEGVLQMPPADKQGKQSIELRVVRVLECGKCDAGKYPLPKTKLTLEFLRDYVHLRPRTNTISAIARIRNELAYATHTFFHDNGFLYVHTPIITTSDCEGAGEMFQVTTLINDAEKLEKELIKNPPPSQEDVDVAKNVVKDKGEIVAKLKADKAGKPAITAAVVELNKAKESLSKLEERFNQKPGIPKKDGKIDYGQDFFARQAFLTVSGQLQVETYACALSSVYTFGPTFRAEHSHTSRHLAEFWMVEPEIAFADIEDDMKCAEAYVRFLCQWLLDNCLDDMEFMVKNFDENAIKRLQMVASTNFVRLSYTEAVAILEEVVAKGHKFENHVEWGVDLASEHEKYLTEIKFKSPVIVYNYPKGIKAFYMKLNEDKKTVAAMDVLVPKISAIARIRNELAYATHTFFHDNGFLYVHTPIVTTSDCEGAGEMFQVTTLINDAEKLEKELIKNPPPSQEDVDVAKNVVKDKGEIVAKLKADKAGKPAITAAVVELNKAKESLSKLEERFNQKPGIPKKDGKIDYGQDFFARQAFLTVSGQLQVETYACALSSVYTFGPTFRAEHSHTSRHLAEFWMVEPEIAFADIEDDMKCAEAYVRFLCQWLLDNCLDDMEFMVKNFDENAIKRLQMVASTNFVRLSYTEAVAILEEVVAKGHKFENHVEWGVDLASEHEKYLTEIKFKSPVIVYNYPKGIKAFYMKLNEDKKTVAAMDVLVPKVGELIGGSQREENYEVIKERILDMGLPLEPYEWYLDLRRYGTVKHSGFGLGFERMILFATGIDNIRDVIPFPRIEVKVNSAIMTIQTSSVIAATVAGPATMSASYTATFIPGYP
ncbi:asparagine--tRNA ligase [Artemisia annua]|uniref:asparagine--tRNA ligase n=1 Tax=Artemisia annua TaxID=35608 RepID=A0A2U1PGC6_ARTAN|nr:asparagine--tRNA ligase [Artemisia annua]